MQRNQITALTVLILLAGMTSCSTIPPGVKAVSPFHVNSYLGKWYEIARIDFRYERNLNNVTADYSLKDNGKIRVVNRGYHTEKKEWKEASGVATFAGEENTGMLKVSFFRPFYSGYNVIAIDPDYRYALVAGESHKYLWILSREPYLPEEIKNNYLKVARDAGFNTADLLWIEHDKQQ